MKEEMKILQFQTDFQDQDLQNISVLFFLFHF